jgi:photosystem II stability/assembly factor-like uncharacterized protein
MKRLLFGAPVLVLALLLFTAFCPPAGAFVSTGDGGWVWQNQLPQGNGGNGVCYADVRHGWATGYWGTILATSDGGVTWRSQDSGTTSTLVGVFFSDAKRGWAVGYDCAIVKTSDGGATWVPSYYGGADASQYRLFSVSFADAKHGWISGAYFDSGRSWWYGLILSTSDGGATWKAQSNYKYDAGLLGVSFADAKHGWAVGYGGLIIATSDGGVHWKRQGSGTLADLTGVSFVDARHGCAVARDGSIYATWNGGAWWKDVRSRKGTLYAVSLGGDTRGWACGASGLILATTDGGAHWKQQNSHMSDDLYAIHFSGASHGCAIGTGGCPVTTANGGRMWTPRGANLTYEDLRGVCFVDDLHGWAVGGDDYLDKIILATTNGGATWDTQYLGAGYPLTAVSFPDTSHGCALANWGGILTTSDAGATWNQHVVTPDYNNYLSGVSFPDATQGWAVGTSGTIYVTSDGGTTWAPQISNTTNNLIGVAFSDASHGWAVGDGGTVLATTDGGAHWNPRSSGTTVLLRSVSLPDASHGWAVGDGGTILATTDGGATWSAETAGTGWKITALSCPDASHGWVVGTGGMILATTTGGWAPPITVRAGAAGGAWYNTELTVALTATAKAPATSVASITYTVDGGLPVTVPGASATVPIAVDAATHENDGPHTLVYAATDDRGTVASDQTLKVNIDTRKPTTRAPYAAGAARGHTAALKYRVLDPAPNGGTATVTIKAKGPTGKLVKTLKLGARPVNTLASLAAKFEVPLTWRAGTYRFFVYATDKAGNRQSNVASNKLVVK